MAIVMGLDQHRAQITAEWIDTETGEVSRSRVSPAHRVGVRPFCERFRGQELEVALEATTGWRFVAEELRRVGAVVHLAEPAETAARRGNKKHAKTAERTFPVLADRDHTEIAVHVQADRSTDPSRQCQCHRSPPQVVGLTHGERTSGTTTQTDTSSHAQSRQVAGAAKRKARARSPSPKTAYPSAFSQTRPLFPDRRTVSPDLGSMRAHVPTT
jgi:hypothetical protein